MKKFPVHHLLRNKYFYTVLAFVIWMLFFDQNRMSSQYKLRNNLKTLEAQKAYYEHEIEQQTALSRALAADTLLLERFAREKYLMKRDNEVVYLVVDQ